MRVVMGVLTGLDVSDEQNAADRSRTCTPNPAWAFDPVGRKRLGNLSERAIDTGASGHAQVFLRRRPGRLVFEEQIELAAIFQHRGVDDAVAGVEEYPRRCE